MAAMCCQLYRELTHECHSRHLRIQRETSMVRDIPKNALNELLTTAQADGLSLSDLSPTCERFCVAPRDVLNALSIAVAQGYLDGSLTYDFCDSAMNGIFGAIIDVGMTEAIPEPSFSLYLAFDNGEWSPSDDPPEAVPSEKYTRPVVVEIMRSLKASL